MVQFKDGSIKAQLGVPDMKIPIQYALTYPRHLSSNWERLDFTNIKDLTFEAPNLERFPCIALAYKALSKKEINKFFENYEKKDNETTDPFFITTKFRRTRYKVFDESYTGNHLCKNIYNTDGRNLMF